MCLMGIAILCGCESKETKLKKDYSYFRQWHYENCLCILEHMPDYKKNLSYGVSKVNAFCRHTVERHINSKPKSLIQQNVSFMRKFGDYQCSDDFIEKIKPQAAKNYLDLWYWRDADDMLNMSMLAGMTELCNSVRKSQDVDCDCVAVAYFRSLSQKEYTALQNAGNIVFPNSNEKSWKNDTPQRKQMTKSIMDKLFNAILKCTTDKGVNNGDSNRIL